MVSVEQWSCIHSQQGRGSAHFLFEAAPTLWSVFCSVRYLISNPEESSQWLTCLRIIINGINKNSILKTELDPTTARTCRSRSHYDFNGTSLMAPPPKCHRQSNNYYPPLAVHLGIRFAQETTPLQIITCSLICPCVSLAWSQIWLCSFQLPSHDNSIRSW